MGMQLILHLIGSQKGINMKKPVKYLLVILTVVGILFLGFKKNVNIDGMQVYETEHFSIYYETLEQKTISDIEERLETSYPGIQNFFSLGVNHRDRLIVYEDIGKFQRAYLGFILSLVYGDWASGAAYQDLILVTSPENPGSEHTYDDTLEIIVHEYVHTLVYQKNEMPNIWLDEGVATYLAGQESELPSMIPGFEALQAEDMSTFLDNNGYAFSYAYVEYLAKAYGNEKVIHLIESNDYEVVFGKSAMDIYNEWLIYMETEYSIWNFAPEFSRATSSHSLDNCLWPGL